MKKLLSILLSILLVSTLVFSVTSCKNGDESESIDESVTPVTITVKTAKEDGKEINTLTEISLSAAAKSYIDEGNLADLENLFKTHKDSTDDQQVKDDISCFTVDAVAGKVKFELPANVTHVASNAVANLTFITDLVVGNKVEEIEKGAFVGLSGLETIKLPFIGSKLGAYNDAKLFAYIFGSIGGDGLTAVTQTYNEGTESTASLYVPTSLKTVTITGDVTYTVNEVRAYKDGDDYIPLADGETAPERFTEVTIETIDYKKSAIQPYAFFGITTVENVILEGAKNDMIPDNAFNGCTGIKELSFNSEIIIGRSAYANCTSLKRITFGDEASVMLLEGAFSGCTALGKATETSKGGLDLTHVLFVDKDAFKGCTSLHKDTLVLGFHTEIDLEDAFDKDFFKEEEEEND